MFENTKKETTFESPVKINELKRGDVFYERGFLGNWGKFIALSDGSRTIVTDDIGQEFPMNVVVVKVIDSSSPDRSRINSIIKFEDDPMLENNRGPRLYRICNEAVKGFNGTLQGDWKRIGEKND